MHSSKHWLRLGLAGTVAASLLGGVLLVACGDDDENVVSAGPEAGNPDVTTPPVDGGPDGDAAPPTAAPAKLTVVHAATDLGPDDPSARAYLCFAFAPKGTTTFAVAPLKPAPDTAVGLGIGTGGSFPNTTKLEDVEVQPFLMNGDKLSPDPDAGAGTRPSCEVLLGATGSGGVSADGGAAQENVDYWKLAAIPAGTLKNDKSYLLALTGCAQNTTTPSGEQAQNCGADFNGDAGTAAGRGNLTVRIYEMDTTAPAAGKLGVQWVTLSPSVSSILSNGPGFIPGIQDTDGGTAFQPFVTDADGGKAPAYPQTGLTKRAELNLPAAASYANNPNSPPFVWTSFTALEAMSGTKITTGKTYVFTEVGQIYFGPPGKNPNHPLAFPTNP